MFEKLKNLFKKQEVKPVAKKESKPKQAKSKKAALAQLAAVEIAKHKK